MDLSSFLQHRVFKVLSKVAAQEQVETYVVGGYVRDLLLYGEDAAPKDIDVVVVGSGILMAEKVREAIRGEVHLAVYKNFGTAMLKWGQTEVEFVGARKESYRSSSRKPMVENGTLEDDQNRRDFTINAMAISLNPTSYGTLLDPFNGVKHLEEKMIKTPLNPGETFSDDPLRMLRGIRFATRLGFHIEKGTLDAISENKERIKIISQERITEELNKILICDQPSVGFKLLESTGLLEIIFPELYQMKGVDEVDGQMHKDNFYHTLEVLDNITKNTDDLWLRWSALLHDIAKPRTKKFEPGTGWTFHAHEFIGAKMIPNLFRKMKLPLNEKMKFVQKMVLLHLRPIVLSQDVVTDSAVRRLIFDAGNDLEGLMILCEADITSKNEKRVKRYLRNFAIVREKIVEIEAKDHVRNFQPPLSGDDIQHVFGIPPSYSVGVIKNGIKEAILDGEIPNEFDAAYQKMIALGQELGLKVQNPIKRENG